MKLSRIVAIVVIGAILVAIGVFVGVTNNWMPVQASAEAPSVDTLFNVMLAIATVVFLIVELGIVYSIIRFRRRAGDDADGPPDHGNTALEVTWTAIPAIIVVALTFYSYKVFADMQEPQPDEMAINVTGQQFTWSFQYNDPNQTDTYDPKKPADADMAKEISANMVNTVLYIPVNRPVRMDIQSKDVMHSFYIPEFRIKQDALPGRTTTVRFTPTVIGDYAVVCTELCGPGHATMHNLVKIVSQDDYDKAVADMRTKAIAGLSDPTSAKRGEQLLTSGIYPCGSCHTLDVIGLKGVIGPSWNGLYTRVLNDVDKRLEGSGIKTTGDEAVREYLNLSIVNPGLFIVPTYQNIMPKNFGDPSVMPDNDRQAIVNFLMQQK